MTDIEMSKKAGAYDIANANDSANDRGVQYQQQETGARHDEEH